MQIQIMIEDALIRATVEQGIRACRYWATTIERGGAYGVTFTPRTPGPYRCRLVTDGPFVAVQPRELVASAMAVGAVTMARLFPVEFGELLSGRGDEIVADLLIQCAIFGGAVFG